jgi:hypothetical protein
MGEDAGGDARWASVSHVPLTNALDTQRNVWISIASPTEQARYYAMAGYCPFTQSLLLAGGFGDCRKRKTEQLVSAKLFLESALFAMNNNKNNNVNNHYDWYQTKY